MLNNSGLEKVRKTQSNIIASSNYNFQIELIKYAGEFDSNKLIEISNELVDIFGPHSSLTEKNIHKYFNEKTLPFIARYNKNIIGYIIGVPLEYFKDEAWSHFDSNLFKENTLYTYAFVLEKKFQLKAGGYAKTLKRIYLSWAKKRGYKFITGHVRQDIAEKFPNTKIIKTFPIWYDAKDPFSYYQRTI
tara:strand:+ start:959 stop:1525 length:567 start_codon:yes stop_codon:yes gene_type:complete